MSIFYFYINYRMKMATIGWKYSFLLNLNQLGSELNAMLEHIRPAEIDNSVRENCFPLNSFQEKTALHENTAFQKKPRVLENLKCFSPRFWSCRIFELCSACFVSIEKITFPLLRPLKSAISTVTTIETDKTLRKF